MGQLVSQSVKQLVNKSVTESVNESVRESISPWQSLNQFIRMISFCNTGHKVVSYVG